MFVFGGVLFEGWFLKGAQLRLILEKWFPSKQKIAPPEENGGAICYA